MKRKYYAIRFLFSNIYEAEVHAFVSLAERNQWVSKDTVARRRVSEGNTRVRSVKRILHLRPEAIKFHEPAQLRL